MIINMTGITRRKYLMRSKWMKDYICRRKENSKNLMI